MRYVMVETHRLIVSLVKDSVPHSQRSTPAAPWQDPGFSPRRVNESPVRSPSTLPDCSFVPRIPGDISKRQGSPPPEICANDPLPALQDLCDSVPLGRLECADG